MIHPSIEKLRRMRLNGMARALEEQLGQPDIVTLSFDERLVLLVDREDIERQNAALAKRLRGARLRQAACLEDIHYRPGRGLDRGLMRSLATGDWLRRHSNILLLGATGVGKSFIACALGNQAARNGLPVRYQRLPRLLDELAMARAESKYARLLSQLSKVRLLILDDWLMVKLTADQRRDLLEVIDDRHQRGSTILATQVPLERWHDQIADPTYADAILDRLVHNAHRIDLRGPSMRGPETPDGKTMLNTEDSEVIPDIHAIHSGATASGRKTE
jgi:DNA replication protein DnaC